MRSFPGLRDISAVLSKSVPLSEEDIVKKRVLRYVWSCSKGVVFSEGQAAVTFIGFSEMTKQRCSWAKTNQENRTSGGSLGDNQGSTRPQHTSSARETNKFQLVRTRLINWTEEAYLFPFLLIPGKGMTASGTSARLHLIGRPLVNETQFE